MANETSFKPGQGGRPKGIPNKSTRLVKDVFATVFSELQNDPKANLQTWGSQNPTEFYKLASKLIPIQLAGDPENPISFTLKDAISFDGSSQPEV